MRPLVTPRLVGREHQRDRLRELWEAAEAGLPGVALLLGEAGSGKTSVSLELVDHVAARSGVVLRGECLPLGGQDLPYGPFLGVLDDMRASPSVSGSLREHVSDLLAAVETAPSLEQVRAGGGPSGRTDRGRLFQRFLSVVTQLADLEPVLLVLEDLHWADRSSLDLLAFLVAGLRRQRLLLLVTARDDEPGEGSLFQLLTELRRRASVVALALPPLPDAAIDALLGGWSVLPASVRREITQRADGNPFYALELRMAWERGATTLPAELADAAVSRLRGITADAQEVVRTAAAIGRQFTDELLASVVDLPEGRCLAALRELLERGALVTDGDSYRFRHALLQEAVYARMAPGERRRVHGTVAPALQRHVDGRGLDLETAVALSFHWRAAADQDAALAAAVRAQVLARHTHAYEEAAHQAEAAIGLWDDAHEHPSGLRLVQLLVQAAEDRRWAGDLPMALAHARRAVSLAGAGDHTFAEQATALERLGQLLWADGDVSRALELHERAVDLARREGMTCVTARTVASWATRLMTMGQYLRAIPVAQEAADAARTLGLATVEAHALTTWGTSQAVSGELDAGLRHLQQARDLARCTADAEELLRAHTNHTLVLLEAGRPGEAAETATQGVTELVGLGVPRAMLAALITNLAIAHWRAGRWQEAQSVAEASLADRGPLDRQYLEALLAELHLARGDTSAARGVLEEMVAAGTTVTEARVTTGLKGLEVELALLEGRASDALHLAAEAVPGLPAVGLYTSALRLCVVCARVLTLGRDTRLSPGDRALAARVHDAISAVLAERHASPDHSSLQEIALLAQCEAELGPHGDDDPGALWAIAADRWRAAGQPYDVAYALVRQAEELAALRRRKGAAERLEEAETLLAPLDAAPLLQRARRLREALGLSDAPVRHALPETASVDPFRDLGITSRERQVLDLLARGRTNRQIGRELGTTERTAGTHVSNLLRKLGVTSRTEAVSVTHQLRRSEGGDPSR